MLSGDGAADDSHGWTFFCDSDHAGNSEPNNHRRSQNGYIALLNGAPVLVTSKAPSVAYANAIIGEAHADTSSAAVEIYAAGNATQDLLHLSYCSEEMNVPFPKPIILQMDNHAAKIFMEDTAPNTKLKHIDVRQEWVKVMRDRDLFTAVHVPGTENLADLFTKILPKAVFQRMRDIILRPIPH